MIERAILVEDDHEMLDRRLRMHVIRMAVIPVEVVLTEDRRSARNRRRDRENRGRGNKSGFHSYCPKSKL